MDSPKMWLNRVSVSPTLPSITTPCAPVAGSANVCWLATSCKSSPEGTTRRNEEQKCAATDAKFQSVLFLTSKSSCSHTGAPAGAAPQATQHVSAHSPVHALREAAGAHGEVVIDLPALRFHLSSSTQRERVAQQEGRAQGAGGRKPSAKNPRATECRAHPSAHTQLLQPAHM